jgi:hypothetical protein
LQLQQRDQGPHLVSTCTQRADQAAQRQSYSCQGLTAAHHVLQYVNKPVRCAQVYVYVSDCQPRAGQPLVPCTCIDPGELTLCILSLGLAAMCVGTFVPPQHLPYDASSVVCVPHPDVQPGTQLSSGRCGQATPAESWGGGPWARQCEPSALRSCFKLRTSTSTRITLMHCHNVPLLRLQTCDCSKD